MMSGVEVNLGFGDSAKAASGPTHLDVSFYWAASALQFGSPADERLAHGIGPYVERANRELSTKIGRSSHTEPQWRPVVTRAQHEIRRWLEPEQSPQHLLLVGFVCEVFLPTAVSYTHLTLPTIYSV